MPAVKYLTISISPRKVGASMLLVLFLFLPDITGMSQPHSTEYQLKAVFIYNFTQFIQWPELAFTSADAPFVIGILGQNVFGTHLEESVSDEYVQHRRIKVLYLKNKKDADQCHIVFTDGTPGNSMKDIMPYVNGKPILTVGESNSFMDQGGMLRFYLDKNKVRIQINAEAALKAGLIINPKLLKLASIFHQ